MPRPPGERPEPGGPREPRDPTPVLGLPVATGGPATMSIPTVRVTAAGAPAAGPGSEEELTIGVAVAIPQPWADYLQDCREAFGDPMARAILPHVTLLPPTVVPAGAIDTVAAHLARLVLPWRAFRLLLRGTATFRPTSPVVFVPVERGGPECDALQRAIRTGPLTRDLSFDFHPHVTLAHHLDDPSLDRAEKELADFSLEFEVDCIWLYEQGGDGVWRRTRRFPFLGDAS